MRNLIIILYLFISCTPQIVKKTSTEEVIGIDVSHYQGNIDWKKVKTWNDNEIQFVYIKSTEGTTYQDKKYKENFTEAISNGFNVGSYHYFRTSSSIEGQFKNFTNNVDKDSQILVPMIDVEENKNWSRNRCYYCRY